MHFDDFFLTEKDRLAEETVQLPDRFPDAEAVPHVEGVIEFAEERCKLGGVGSPDDDVAGTASRRRPSLADVEPVEDVLPACPAPGTKQSRRYGRPVIAFLHIFDLTE